jgi:glycosyltransferase involved in cell wall biosynthesis
VVNDGDNNRLVSDNPFIAYVEPSPHRLARALGDVVEYPYRACRACAASESVQTLGWEDSAARVEQILLRTLRERVTPLAGALRPEP